MRELTIDHVAAISRATAYIQPHLVPNMSPIHRKAVEDDMERLADVKLYILDIIYHPNPPLPTNTPGKP